ncbi:NADP-dependent malic enzyme [Piscirickettsia salmonis]|uniref:malic enzyme-like NAD(P)-binding protein n=1 Tax=Piscirickettsia salmonis TaxID=1238 RepID=UPI0012BAEC6B|nr:malic enzyme-like NAD(P)-binding protein [Piscirickettsia salmonis]QGP52907.1 NADP-dependent malic enzyme [Piscirickettsia salmonis]QGP61168.1 NADP-dependent malic enzyme [Piscirickettsia salmonis]QGP62479.1 NADP-dependent malic enzyme [Piscirickettsia salmonis]
MSNIESKQAALDYHSKPVPGKLSISVTKSMETQQDLSLAYSPGVAEPVRAIAEDPNAAYRYTSKGNTVAVISNGSAVLGLGNVGALASKPVMEGKAALFKRFANIDAIDIEVDADNPSDLINTIARISPSFGGINLEDIKAPECFQVEHALHERLDIPVFHDDQHGTAITIAAGLLNALKLQGKELKNCNIVCVGAGAAGLTSMRLLTTLGASRDKIFVIDREGVIHSERQRLNPYKYAFAIETDKRSLEDAVRDADIFIGLSAPNILTPEMLATMAAKPIIFALSNPDPEIHPAVAHKVRDDIIMATGRSDFPNQVNNLLVFPFIFRGALDVRAKRVNMEMQIAAVNAIRDLAHKEAPKEVVSAYAKGEILSFGAEYILPKPMDPRLIECVPAAVAKAAIETGVAQLGYPSHYPE